MICNHRELGAWLVLCVTAFAPLAAAQQQSRPASTEPLLKLNQALDAYVASEYDIASKAFEEILQDPAASEYQITCHYYLGLIALQRGVSASGAAQSAKVAATEAEKTKDAAELARQRELLQLKGEEALTYFNAAQDHLQVVVTPEDPALRVVDAALLLGIARLARDVGPEAEPGASAEAREKISERAIALATHAVTTLSDYVKTDTGARDAYGYFYLGVAQYRLTDEYSRRGKFYDAVKRAENLNLARANFEHAAELARAETGGETRRGVTPQYFDAVVTYYRALLDTVAGPQEYLAARTLFNDVKEMDKGPVGRNAEDLSAQLDQVLAAYPPALRLPVPAPIGPLEFDGRVRIGNWYDSDVILLGINTPLPRGYSRQDDYTFGLDTDFNISRYISKTEAPWVLESLTVGVGGSVANMWHPNITQFDVNRYAGRAYLNWQVIPDLYVGLQYEGSYTQLGHAPYLASQRLTPVISKIWRGTTGKETGRTDLYYTLDNRSYQYELTDWRFNQTGVYQSAGLVQTFNLVPATELPYMTGYFASHPRERQFLGENDWLKFHIGGEGRDEPTVGTEWALAGGSLTCGMHVPLPYRFAFDVDGEFTWLPYYYASVFDYTRETQFVSLQRYNFGLTYTFVARGEYAAMPTLDVKLRTGVELTFQDSNVMDRLGGEIYSYNRGIYGAALEVGF